MHSTTSIGPVYLSSRKFRFHKKCFRAHVQHFMDVASVKLKRTLLKRVRAVFLVHCYKCLHCLQTKHKSRAIIVQCVDMLSLHCYDGHILCEPCEADIVIKFL